jgi:hypothetical protein
VGAVVVHSLKIVFHDAGSHSEIYLALDSADIAKLKAVLERAETKAASLKSLLEDKQISNLAFS